MLRTVTSAASTRVGREILTLTINSESTLKMTDTYCESEIAFFLSAGHSCAQIVIDNAERR
jgi:hypothetical protein